MTRSTSGTSYELTGPSAAPVVVQVHGLGLTRATWDGFVPALAQSYRVLTYDLCGHGESALPPDKPSLSVLSGQLVNLLDELGIARAAIVGFSLGGMINRRFAMDHPGRVSALVILNSPHERSPEAQRLVEARAAETGAGGPLATIDATLERWFTPRFRQDAANVVAKIRTLVLANSPNTYTQHRQVLAFYTDVGIAPAIAPFTQVFSTVTNENAASAPIDFGMDAWSREGLAINCIPPFIYRGCIVGVPPPSEPLRLNWASNVISFNQSQAGPTSSRILGSSLNFWIDFYDIFDGGNPGEGSFRMELSSTEHLLRADLSGRRLRGLPVHGFWVASYTNGILTPGVLSNYSDAVRHQTRTSISP